MKQLLFFFLIIIGLPTCSLANDLTWECHVKEANQLVSQGQFEKAINYLSAQAKRDDLDDRDKYVIALNAVSLSFQYGDQKQAIFIIKPVYDKLVRKYGVKSLPSFMARKILIQAYLKRREFDQAFKYAQLSVQSATTKKDVAEAYLNLADVYRDKKNFRESVKYYLKAESLYKELNDKGKYNNELSIIYNNMAFTYKYAGDYQRALTYFQASSQIHPKDKKSYYSALHKIADIYSDIGEVNKAKSYLIEAANFYLKTYGENSFKYIMLENELGVLEQDYGHYNEALSYYQKVINYGERLNREEIKALGLKNTGSAYLKQGHVALAETYLEKALAIYQRLPLSLRLADNYEGLALLASETNFFDKEINYYDKALEVYRLLHLENKPSYAYVLTNKGMAYQKQQQFDQADKLYSQACAILKKTQPQGQKLGFLLVNWGTLQIEKRQYKEAEVMLLEAIKLLKQTVGESHPEVAYAYNNLARLYSLKKKYSEAVNFYSKAFEISKVTEGPNHPSTKLYRDNLLKVKILKRFSRS